MSSQILPKQKFCHDFVSIFSSHADVEQLTADQTYQYDE